jgi:hypothetical protein
MIKIMLLKTNVNMSEKIIESTALYNQVCLGNKYVLLGTLISSLRLFQKYTAKPIHTIGITIPNSSIKYFVFPVSNVNGVNIS